MNVLTLGKAPWIVLPPLMVLLAVHWLWPAPSADVGVTSARDGPTLGNRRAAADARPAPSDPAVQPSMSNADQVQAAGPAAPGYAVEPERAVADAQSGRWLVELGNGTPDVREQFAVELGQSRDVRAVPALARALADSNSGVRRAAVESLADIGGADAASALAVALRDSDARNREAAVNALGDIGGPTSIKLLQQALGDVTEFVRLAAADTLEELARKR